MLGDKDVTVVLGVKDLEAAGKFYEQTLGLKRGGQMPGGVIFESGKCAVFVYETEFAGTNKATAATWSVDDIKAVVADLEQKGVTFEQYDIPESTREGVIHIMGTMQAVWFKDPDGNILNIVSM